MVPQRRMGIPPGERQRVSRSVLTPPRVRANRGVKSLRMVVGMSETAAGGSDTHPSHTLSPSTCSGDRPSWSTAGHTPTCRGAKCLFRHIARAPQLPVSGDGEKASPLCTQEAVEMAASILEDGSRGNNYCVPDSVLQWVLRRKEYELSPSPFPRKKSESQEKV